MVRTIRLLIRLKYKNIRLKVFLVMQRTRFFNLADFSLQVYEECRKQDIPVVVTDLLHYVKAARSRYIDQSIGITSADWNARTDPGRVDQLFGLNLVISDKSQLGRMRDFYPLELFTIHNICVLLEEKCFADAFYFLPHALLLVVIVLLTHPISLYLLIFH